ncbi:MAG: hypothetical protein ABJO27_23280 [Pseudoruegeria sp.]
MELDESGTVVLSMQFSDAEAEALQKARELLRHSGSLFCDSIFDHEIGQDPVVDRCLDPIRAFGDSQLNEAGIVVAFDTNYLIRMSEILTKEPGTNLVEDERRVLATIALSGFCNASLTPGFALAEMYSENRNRASYLHDGFKAFDYLCVQSSLEDIFEGVVSGKVPNWNLNIPTHAETPLDTIRTIAENRKSKIELYACLCAAIIERVNGVHLDENAKLEAFIARIFKTGAFAVGSLRYFALYFSEEPAKRGIPRKSMLKSVHSPSHEKAAAGVRNAARDCYLASEYSSSLNSFHERTSSTVYATEDRALQHLLKRDWQERDTEGQSFSSSLRNLRGGNLPKSVESIIDKTVSSIPIELIKATNQQPLRSSAHKFMENPDQAITLAWKEFNDLF